MKKKKLYCVSGLGADNRVFYFLNIDAIPIVHIIWEAPEKSESIQAYCQKLIKQIDPSSLPILLGVSFGGIIAQEISKLIPIDKLIIISSIKAREEMDWKLKFVSSSKIHKLFSSRFLKWSNLWTADYYFGTESKSESDLLKSIIKDTDPVFMKWAINEIMNWNPGESLQPKVIHIHGTNDHIFPIRSIKNAIEIKMAVIS